MQQLNWWLWSKVKYSCSMLTCDWIPKNKFAIKKHKIRIFKTKIIFIFLNSYPKQCWLITQPFLPIHFLKHIIGLCKEISDLGTLIVPFSLVKYFIFLVNWEVFTKFGNRKDDLLQGSVVSNNFNLSCVFIIISQSFWGFGIMWSWFQKLTDFLRK